MFLVVDLLCGWGGTSVGYEQATKEKFKKYAKSLGVKLPSDFKFDKLCKIVGCVNHDRLAIQNHLERMPEVEHFLEDIRLLDPYKRLKRLVELYRAFYPEAKLILFAGIECTNHSKAKGGLSRDGDSRTLADHLINYIDALDPDYVKIENVTEFEIWGPLLVKEGTTKDGYRFSLLNYKKLRKLSKVAKSDIPDTYYENEYGDTVLRPKPNYLEEMLNPNIKYFKKKSNAYEITPYFIPDPKYKGIFFKQWCDKVDAMGYRNEWRKINSADFGAYTSRNRLFGCFAKPGLPICWPVPTHSKKGNAFTKQWKAVKDVLDFSDEGVSIFNRKKPLSAKTIQRLFLGSVKHIAGKDKKFIKTYFPDDILERCVAAGGTQIEGTGFVITSDFIQKYYSTGGQWSTIFEPAGTLTTKDRFAKVTAKFIDKQYSNGSINSSINEPLGTITTVPKSRLVNAEFFIDKQYTGEDNHQSIQSPAGTILTNDKHALVRAEKYLMNTNFNNVGHSLENPAPTLTASRRHHYLVNPSWGVNNGTSVENPSPVIIARQDKAPLYVVSCEEGKFSIPIYETDCLPMIKLKFFMIMYGIVDISMRMLSPEELLRIQGFPEQYDSKQITSTNLKKFVGNSVVPLVPEHWAYAFVLNYSEQQLKLAA